MKILRIKLINKPNPYQSEPGIFREAWGEISIQIHDKTDVKLLTNIEWDVLPLLEWFIENRTYISSEVFSILGEKPYPNESISKALYRIRLAKFLDPQEPDNIIHQRALIYDAYYDHHSLLTGLMGSKMPNIILGLNNNKGEISYFNQLENWEYEFEMETFMQELQEEAIQFVSNWLKVNNNPIAQEQGIRILKELGN